MGSSKLVAALFLALALAATTTQATRAEPSLALALAPSPSPSSAPSDQPSATTSSCLSWFMGMTPCMDFLTDADVEAPSGTCCKGLESLVDGAAVCLCHAMNGDIDNFMPANTDFSRVSDLPATCGVSLPAETLSKCHTKSIVYMDASGF
jgi:hypothetical protein